MKKKTKCLKCECVPETGMKGEETLLKSNSDGYLPPSQDELSFSLYLLLLLPLLREITGICTIFIITTVMIGDNE